MQVLRPGTQLGRRGTARRRARNASSSATQGGFSLVEVLVAVFLAGTVVLAIGAGVLATLRSSNATESLQRARAALTSVTENAKALPYQVCSPGQTSASGAAAYQALYASWPGRWVPPPEAGVVSVTVVGVSYWEPAADRSALGTFSTACPASDLGAQELSIEVRMESGRTLSGTTVLRRPA